MAQSPILMGNLNFKSSSEKRAMDFYVGYRSETIKSFRRDDIRVEMESR